MQPSHAAPARRRALAECDARLRFRSDHYGADCQAATEASLACIAELSCDEMETFACEPTEIDEVTTCEGDRDPSPEVIAFCEAQVECDIPQSVCELATLEDFVYSSYLLGCENEYAALLACVAPLGCMTTDPEIEAECGDQSDAIDAVCPRLVRLIRRRRPSPGIIDRNSGKRASRAVSARGRQIGSMRGLRKPVAGLGHPVGDRTEA